MKLSLKVEYACRVLAQLARSHGDKQLVHIEHLADAEEIPKNYLVQILSELRGGGLITSRRGKQGGYALIKAPAKISLFDIVQVVDSELLDKQFNTGGQSGGKVAEVWQAISDKVEAQTRLYSLEDLMPADDGAMYHI